MDQDNRTPNPYYNRPDSNQTNNINNEPSPFYHRPGQSTDNDNRDNSQRQTQPYNAFASASMVLAVIALVSVFTFTIIPAIIFGSLALILALLSRGRELTFHPKAKTAVIVASLAICTNIAMIGGVFGMIFGDNPYHDMINQTYEEMYGMTYDEILEGIMDGSIDYEDLYEDMYDNMYEDLFE